MVRAMAAARSVGVRSIGGAFRLWDAGVEDTLGGEGKTQGCRGGLEGGFDGGDDLGIVGWGVGGEAGEDVAVAADEEFFEVPEELGEGVGAGETVGGREFGDAFAPGSVDDVGGLGGDELSIERVLGGAGDGSFGEEREGDGVVDGAEGGDLRWCRAPARRSRWRGSRGWRSRATCSAGRGLRASGILSSGSPPPSLAMARAVFWKYAGSCPTVDTCRSGVCHSPSCPSG